MKTRSSTYNTPTKAKKRLKSYINNDLVDSCIKGNYNRVVELLARPEWKNCINGCGGEDGLPPIWYAVRYGQDRIVRALLDSGADTTGSFRYFYGTWRHILHIAVQYGSIGTLQVLLSRDDVDPNVQDSDGSTPLLYTYHRNDPAFLRMLLAANADPNIVDNAGISPLIWSIDCALDEHVRILLEGSADPNLQSAMMETPLIVAISNNSTPIIRRLLMAGANPNYPTLSLRRNISPLTYAIKEGQVETVELLLNAGADPNNTSDDFDDRTPLILASGYGSESIIRLLLKAGADPNLRRTCDGSSPLLEAVRFGRGTVVQLLLDAGGDPNLHRPRIETGVVETPLNLAVKQGQESIARLLLAAGNVSPNALQNHPSPLYIAASTGNTSLVKLLLDFNANPNLLLNIEDPNSCPFVVATRMKHHNVIYLLLPYMLFRSSEYTGQKF
jgi:ankyrin repeat protein